MLTITTRKARGKVLRTLMKHCSPGIDGEDGNADDTFGCTVAHHACGWQTVSCRRGLHQSSLLPIFHDNKVASTRLQSFQSPLKHTCRNMSSSPRVFVSKHNQLNIASRDILDFLDQNGVETASARVNNSHVILQECPFCSKPTKGKTDNQYKCYVQVGGGAYFCHRCGAGGSWYDLKLKLGNFQVSSFSNTNADPSEAHPMENIVSTSRHSRQQPPHHNSNSRITNSKKPSSNSSPIPPLPMPPPRLQAAYSSQLLDRGENKVVSYLQETRGLKPKTLRKYGVGRATYKFLDTNNQWIDSECVTFPWIMTVEQVQYQESLRGADFHWDAPESSSSSSQTSTPSAHEDESLPKDSRTDNENESQNKPQSIANSTTFVTRRIKARALEKKSWQRLDPAGGGWGLFGFHTVPKDAKEIVLTEGEYDAMAVWQETGLPAVSLPNGCRSLPVEVLPLLEDFDKVYLWMDADGPGQEGAENFAKKIGIERCYIVRPEIREGVPAPKDANEALLQGVDLTDMIHQARVTPHECILTFKELRSEVLHEIMNPDKYVGTPMTSLPTLTSLIKGFRRGEMTVITGATGSGKTTFLSQLSLDLAEQDINILWGSFEVKNTRLMHKLLQQFAREPLPTGQPSQLSKLEAIADRFTRLPFYFMKFHGGSDVDDVLDAMEYAVYVNDVEHIILDNMQFMISRKENRSTFDKFDIQDVAIEKFRKFATEHNVHVSLVVHPRKEHEDSRLGIASIYGSAKATQEADTVLILQREGRRKWIDVKKNRFSGDLGLCQLQFDPVSNRYEDATVQQVRGNAAQGDAYESESSQTATRIASNKKGPFSFLD